MFLEILIAGFSVMLLSLLGVIIIQNSAQKFLENKLSFLVSFSAGVFLVTAGALGLEVFALADTIWIGAGLISIGYVSAWILHSLLPETHHHHDINCTDYHGAARKVLIGHGIHNATDGVVLVTAFSVSPALGLAVTTSIVIHEALQGISQFFLLRQAGYSVVKSLIINFAVSTSILLGILIGYFAFLSEGLEMILLAVSSGFFLHVVVHDLIPKPAQHETLKEFIKHLFLLIIGAVLMGVISGHLKDTHSPTAQINEASQN